MFAWTIDHTAPGGLMMRQVPDPEPLPGEVLVRVEAFAPNPGDLASLPELPSGSIPGWDGSGTVVRASTDDNRLQRGERVIFLGAAGGWAQLRSVSTTMLATAPAEVAWELLAALPVPATSALRAVRRLGSILWRRVLVVGAGSAVGRIAVQVAAASGAYVIAMARNDRQHAMLRRLGAAETHRTLSSVEDRVHGAIDLIGGQHLVDAYGLLEPGGEVIALGHAAGADERFPYGAFVADAATTNRVISSFFLGAEPDLAAEMTHLVNQLAHHGLDVGQLAPRPWRELFDWTEAGSPQQSGRTVFRVDHQR